jgi:prevent-host-death family protein
MTTMTVTQARAKFTKLIDETAVSHRPVLITTKRRNAILISEEDWNAVQETLYLQSIPGMVESIVAGAKERSSSRTRWKGSVDATLGH